MNKFEFSSLAILVTLDRIAASADSRVKQTVRIDSSVIHSAKSSAHSHRV